MAQNAADAVLDDRALAAFDKVCDLQLPVIDDFRGARLQDLEILITGWGCPPIDEAVLDAAPKLRAVVHTAGSVRAHITQACWDRGIEVSSAAAANAVPVAEYTVAMILLSGKRALERARDYKTVRRREEWLSTPRTIGNFGRTIGILSASLIGRRVIELLRPYDLNLLLHDPYVLEGEIDVPLVSIEELFERSDLVSVHTPLLSTTHGLVSRELIGMMRPDAVLLNTARGAVVDQDALAEAARRGDVRAILDVTDPEVLPPEHPLWDCENVLITPHLAGSQGNEWDRLADLAAAEIERWATGSGFAYPVKRERLDLLA
ncbi:hydroxyacid dehydrogenase [Fodinicola feengrottensis]|uniref:Hydroxyacid dehydrogenase n=1 Tax=Fodinicola feengrottensis TaxID=435914 RepID=A0ABN2ISE5_9ACTN